MDAERGEFDVLDEVFVQEIFFFLFFVFSSLRLKEEEDDNNQPDIDEQEVQKKMDRLLKSCFVCYDSAHHRAVRRSRLKGRECLGWMLTTYDTNNYN
jgi:hypothetical protein